MVLYCLAVSGADEDTDVGENLFDFLSDINHFGKISIPATNNINETNEQVGVIPNNNEKDSKKTNPSNFAGAYDEDSDQAGEDDEDVDNFTNISE